MADKDLQVIEDEKVVSDEDSDPISVDDSDESAANNGATTDDDDDEEEYERPDPDETEVMDGDRFKSYIKVKIGQLLFDSTNGDILGQPYIRLSTYQYSSARFILNDPDDSLRPGLEAQQHVEIEIGFVGGPKRNVFMGELYNIGRIPPDGTEVEAIDPSAALQGTSTGSQHSAEQVANNQANGEPSGDEETNETDKETDDETATDESVENEPTEEQIDATNEENQTDRPGSADAIVDTSNTKVAQQSISKAATNDSPNFTMAEQVTNPVPRLKFENASNTGLSSEGNVRVQKSEMSQAQDKALAVGDVVVTQGNTVAQVSPGEGFPSGLILNYSTNPSAFFSPPRIRKKTALQLQSAFGSLTVEGWNMEDKGMVGATVSTPNAPGVHPTGSVSVPQMGDIVLAEPIFNGCIYTWGDATREGERPPESQDVVEGIVRIAQIMQMISDTYNSGERYQINSWYRPLHVNRSIGSSDNSRHVFGDAIDFYGATMMDAFAAMDASHQGGVAISPGSFVHVDTWGMDGTDGPPMRRWTY